MPFYGTWTLIQVNHEVEEVELVLFTVHHDLAKPVIFCKYLRQIRLGDGVRFVDMLT